MALVIVGIDEAGYGPLLGPLCVGMTALRVEGWSEGEPAPNLWRLLTKSVCRKAGDSRGRVAVADSKKLKLPNEGAPAEEGGGKCGRHPLEHLERGVLAFLACTQGAQNEDGSAFAPPETDAALFERLGARIEDHRWYDTEPVRSPCAHEPAAVSIAANVLRGGLASAGVTVLAVRCAVIGERQFNETVRRTGSKAAATEIAVRAHLADAWSRWGGVESGADGTPCGLRVVCDRQGGRLDYGPMLSGAIADARVTESERGPARCRYEVERFDGDACESPCRRMGVHFQPEAEDAHLPVALASMTAKLVRELLMGRFNRHWRGRMPELKPTAGYRGDAWRWLSDAAPVMEPSEREAMTRIA